MPQHGKVGYAPTPDGYHIAYRVLGQGELCHVFMAHGVSVVDEIQWQHPGLVRFERLYASLSRLVLIDVRGIGDSDAAPLDGCYTPAAAATDILAVLDALGVERAVISGEGYAGHAAAHFAVAHPGRTLRLALNNSYARLTRPDGSGLETADVDEVVGSILPFWGTGRPSGEVAPAFASDPSFREYFAGRERRTASPSAIAAWLRAMATSDIRALLPRISVPTLVYYTGDLTTFPAEDSRHLADLIPGAILVEAPGNSFYAPTEAERQTAWAEFIVGGHAALSNENRLLTLLFTDVVGSTEHAAKMGDARWARVLGDLDQFVVQRVERYGGRVVKRTGDGHLIAFELPRQALRAACEIALGVHVLGIEVRCGLHAGEVELLTDGDLGGIAVHAAARVCGAAGERQVLTSRTVTDLVAGSEFRFEDRGAHDLKGVPGTWTLYECMK